MLLCPKSFHENKGDRLSVQIFVGKSILFYFTCMKFETLQINDLICIRAFFASWLARRRQKAAD
jgi:hypothetical protein